ncbi:hypothetical protein [Bordetella genomosp. 9]|uniref:hypothetical protein n=1 Tax=Bordetella genomosp. 9 TaxID=1416803 RepID=UPI0011773ED6|nr:hypothetical protein [Bordetella genomosp. 9]
MSNLDTPRQTPSEQYQSVRIGEQMRVHLERRAAIRRAVPLLPRRWAELFALWRRPAGGDSGKAGAPEGKLAPHAR